MKLYFGNMVTTVTTIMIIALVGFIGYIKRIISHNPRVNRILIYRRDRDASASLLKDMWLWKSKVLMYLVIRENLTGRR